MLIKDIALTAAEIVGDSVALAALNSEEHEENTSVKLMLTSVLSALKTVAADFPEPKTNGVQSSETLDAQVDCTSADVYAAAYLAARNYCLFKGHTDEASCFAGLYDDVAERHRLKRRASVPPPRRLT